LFVNNGHQFGQSLVASVYALLFFQFLHQLVLVMPPSHIVIVHGWLAPLPGCSHRRRTGQEWLLWRIALQAGWLEVTSDSLVILPIRAIHQRVVGGDFLKLKDGICTEVANV
jgi:hypothetical protein